ncbi:MAG: type II toxin-antitoxin system HicB family antitoxin [Planctomycetota bacterium]
MTRHFTLEYWKDDGWYVGRLKEVPGVFSQGETLEELSQNIRDAYHLMYGRNRKTANSSVQYTELEVEV